MKKLIVFDWDGVIANSCSSFFHFYRSTAEHFGKAFPLKTLEDFREWYDPAWENNFVRLGFTPQEVPMAKEYQLALVNYDHIPLFPEMRAILHTLFMRFTLAIASTTHSPHIRKKLKSEGMDSLFSFISGGEGGTSDKKGIIAKTLKALNVPPECAVMVGDTIMDITSSKVIGLRSIGVTYGWISPRRMVDAMPDYIVHSPEGILPALQRIFSS